MLNKILNRIEQKVQLVDQCPGEKCELLSEYQKTSQRSKKEKEREKSYIYRGKMKMK